MLDMGRHWKMETGRFGLRTPLRRSIGPDLVVDLGEDIFSADWWRGAATLALLCSAAVALMPAPFAPIMTAPGGGLESHERAAFADLGLASLNEGGGQTGAMAPGAAAMPIARAPMRSHLDLEARLASGDTLAALLQRLGATGLAAREVAAAVGPIEREGADLKLRLGASEGQGRAIDRLSIRTSLNSIVHVAVADGRIAVTRETLATDRTPLRFDGIAGEGLYFSMRASGVSSGNAAAFLKLVDERIDLSSDVMPGDRFTLVMDHERDALGQSQPGDLLYASLARQGGSDLALMKWTVGGRSMWVDLDKAGEMTRSSGRWPVAGPISSGFGMRRHPILRYNRMHSGLDFKAGWGTPIVAAADGTIIGAGRAGGYGKQVRIAHDGGLSSSYSHMSRFIVSPGMTVREGQVIGYVGSTGLSTGPHLHYEVRRHGRAVDPRGVRFSSRPLMSEAEVAAMKAAAAKLLDSARG